MTFFYRSPQERPAPVRSGFAIRLASSLALLAYPAGCLSLLFAPDAAAGPAGMIGALAWLALLLISLGAFVYLAPSYQQRIVGEQADKRTSWTNSNCNCVNAPTPFPTRFSPGSA
tara:strand:+ start:407 stop:751 length:345 start_codon:yes stop_codon:yes gene_type:complete